MTKKSFYLAVALLVGTSPLFAEMYRYLDEDGQVVYSQFRPETETEAATVKAPPPPPSTAEQSRQQLIDSLQKNEDTKLDQKTAHQKAVAEAAEKERQRKNCAAARKNLKAYTADKEKRIVDPEGNEMQVSDYKRNQEIKRAQEAIARDCK